MKKSNQVLLLLGAVLLAGFLLSGKPQSIVTGQSGDMRFEVASAIATVSPSQPLIVWTGYKIANCCGSTPNDELHYVKLSIDGQILTNHCIAQNYGGATNIPYSGNDCAVPYSSFSGKTGRQVVKMETAGCFPGSENCQARISCDSLMTSCQPLNANGYVPMAWTHVKDFEVLIDDKDCLLNADCKLMRELEVCPNCPSCPVCPSQPGCPTCPAQPPVSFDWTLLGWIALFAAGGYLLLWRKRK